MADRSLIEWTDTTWNVINGCAVVSPGCTNCYAMRLAGTRFRDHPTRRGLTIDSKAGPVWNGQVRLIESLLDQPLRWRRPRRIFVCAHGDLFHESVPDAWIDRVFAVMALAPQHTFQVLTKRAARMRAYLRSARALQRVMDAVKLVRPLTPSSCQALSRIIADRERVREQWAAAWARIAAAPLPNVWLGVSVEDQVRADERIPILLDTPAAVRWISAEPLLGPVDLSGVMGKPSWVYQPLRGVRYDPMQPPHYGHVAEPTARIAWVVAGGESGPGARPMHPDWARRLRDQCAAAGVPFLFKQWGDWLPWLQFNEAGVGDDSEQTRFDTVIWQDDRWDQLGRPLWCDVEDDYGGGASGPDEPDQVLGRVGKKAAGRLLDGQLHDAYPEARP